MHNIQYVHIAGDKVKIECSCGWVSKEHDSEAKATKEYDDHAKDDD